MSACGMLFTVWGGLLHHSAQRESTDLRLFTKIVQLVEESHQRSTVYELPTSPSGRVSQSQTRHCGIVRA